MSATPGISVIIPAFNRAAFLRTAIESALSQTAAPSEILVVDDGSTDDSRDVALSFGPPVSLISQANAGVAAARNAGIARSSGNLLAFLDDDDLWPKDSLELRAAALAEDRSADMVLGHFDCFTAEPPESTRLGRPRPAMLCSALLARRSAIERAGPFRVSRRLGEFIDWFAMACDSGIGHRVLPDLVLWRRVHAGNMVRQRHTDFAEYPRLIKDILDRRRRRAKT